MSDGQSHSDEGGTPLASVFRPEMQMFGQGSGFFLPVDAEHTVIETRLPGTNHLNLSHHAQAAQKEIQFALSAIRLVDDSPRGFFQLGSPS